jgi:hypothetical protein
LGTFVVVVPPPAAEITLEAADVALV